MNSIFVQIASYRDPELIPTLKDLINKSNYPEMLRIVVCWQHSDENETIEDFLSEEFNVIDFVNDGKFTKIYLEYNNATIELIDVPHMQTKGACWARNLIQQEYNVEKYTLQLDSHHRFIEKWDETLIKMLEELRTKESPKPILTAYLPSYDPEKDPEGRVNVPWRMNFDKFIPEGAVFFMPQKIPNWQMLEKAVPARFYSGHFCFADGKFSKEVQHDPEYFFHGEEISIAVRAFTHGYDLFHPHIVVAWHEYTRKNRIKMWDEHVPTAKNSGTITHTWTDRNDISHNRNRILFGMDGNKPDSIDFGKYGFGKNRSLRDYEEYAGICFEKRGVTQATLDKELPYHKKTHTPDKEWYESFAHSVDVRIHVPIAEWGDILDDYDFFYVGAHDANGMELYRNDLNKNEVNESIKKGAVDFQLSFVSTQKPSSYSIWTHSKSKGWCVKVTKQI